ncbi:cyclase family protein [Elongatibacter sediminis]|uniref:Cyclase family protein n=1 Tax=Elongatibacter sediminis TaxID=3119006 RepID=A0AAW9RDT4_9GAMM
MQPTRVRRTVACARYRVAVLLFAVVAWSSGFAAGNNPVDEAWWPSVHGADDQLGAIRSITPEKRLEAAGLVRQGRTLTLGMPYQRGMPMMSSRTFSLIIPGGGRPVHGPYPWQGDDFQLTYNDEFIAGELGQIGTQFDGLGHVMVAVHGQSGWRDGNYLYNGRRLEDYSNGYGLRVNGVEHAAEVGFFTRGVLIDMPALLGVERMQAGQEVTLADYRAALDRQGVDEPGAGDVVLIRTGWIQLWKSYLDEHGRISGSTEEVAAANALYGSAEPGVAPELCDHLAGRGIAMLMADQGAIEPVGLAADGAQEDTGPFGYCHVNLLARRGIYLFENIDMEALSEQEVYEFLFTWAPLKLVGATGSPGNPMVAW